MTIRTLTILSALLVASAALAHEGVKDPTVKAWMDHMTAIGKQAKALTQMARGQTQFSESAAKAALATMAERSAAIPARFETRASDPKSEVNPVIWEDWEGFVAAADALDAAIASADVSSPATLRASVQSIGKTCGACHEAYRIER